MAARIPEKTKADFFELVELQGMSIRRAAGIVGMSYSQGSRLLGQRSESRNRAGGHFAKQRQEDLPPPKNWEELGTDAQECLRDFGVFQEMCLAMRPVPWQRDAAMRVVEALLDREERTFIVANEPPGAGKTTLFTFEIPAWILLGGGFVDPTFGRALRILLGSEAKKVAEHYVLRLRRLFELRRPFWNKNDRRSAELILPEAFGRIKPELSQGDEKIWARDQFMVAQHGDVDIYEKEPSVQAASRESGFLGERVDYQSWDDIATPKNSRNPEIAETLSEWFEDQAETRTEPGGVCMLVGQRLGPLDLHRKRLDASYPTEDGETVPKYRHIVYPVHNESTCDGTHRQWDGREEGCLLDEVRYPWREVLRLTGQRNYRTVYQQEDVDPDTVLVRRVWIDGGLDELDNYMAPGCYDRERGFLEWPQNVGPLINYGCVDVSATGWWCLEWWAVQPKTGFRYLIYGTRRRMPAGTERGFLDFNLREMRHIGILEELQRSSHELGHGIRVWVIEVNAFAKHLLQYEHYQTWRARWPEVSVIPHETQRNKLDPVLGVEATLPTVYRAGLKRLPYRGMDCLNYIRAKVRELTEYVPGKQRGITTDTIMADWFGEYNMGRVQSLGGRDGTRTTSGLVLPDYLKRRQTSRPLQSV